MRSGVGHSALLSGVVCRVERVYREARLFTATIATIERFAGQFELCQVSGLSALRRADRRPGLCVSVVM